MHYLTLFWLWICSIPAWLDVHPTIVALIVVPLVTGAVSAVAKPRTPEQFAKMPFVIAQLLRLWAAVFPDPAKAVAILVALITRRAPSPDTVTTGKLPPDPPSAPGGGLVMAFLFVVALFVAPLFVASCTPAQSKAIAGGIANEAQCIEAHAVPGADPKDVAIACGIDAIPDVVNIISSVVQSKTIEAKKLSGCTVIVVDAGAPVGVGK